MDPHELSTLIHSAEITTVVVGFTDHYGRLMGKRFDAEFFLAEIMAAGTHGCDYLLTVDMEMEPVEGYAFANWGRGYGDMHLVPDLSTLRRAGWAEGTALVLCDVVDDDTHEPVEVAPRSILRRQVRAAAEAGFEVRAASELELYLYRTSYRDASRSDYRDLEPAGWYVEDYHLLQGARVDDYMGAARRALVRSEVPVESTKGEAAVGQHEVNIRHASVLDMADRHVIMKQGLKELAEAQGVSATFMAKPDAAQPGNSCHLHLSLWSEGANAFVDQGSGTASGGAGSGGGSDLFRWFLGGWMRHAPELMACYAPTVNSYKRYQDQSWAPTRLAWSTDNRTVAFRIVGRGPGLRIECRIPGADVNPYLAYAAAIASGLDGIANHIEPPPELSGDAYTVDADTVDAAVGPVPGGAGSGTAGSDRASARLPTTLAEATERFATSGEARRLLGDTVVDHYAHHLAAEVEAFGRAVTDWERRRYFERI
jgi:glutamine synthetase